jgi:formylmethanofuran dehydrogenase subunit B
MPAWIEGRSVSTDDAVAAAGRLLAGARQAIVGGLAADVDAIRAAYRLAFRLGASLDANGSEGLYAELAVLAGSGVMATTRAEARARADLVLAVGTTAARSPMLAAISAGEPSRGDGSRRRRLVVVAEEPAPATNSGSGLHVPLVAGSLAATLGLIRAVAGKRLAPDGRSPGLAEIGAGLPEASFGVAIYDPGELGELAVDMLQGLVKELNAATRFTTLSLAQAGRAALQVGAWTTGDGPRTGLARAYPEHDPWRFDAARLIAADEADAGLWIGPLAAPSWSHRLPAAALISGAAGREAAIVIDVAKPGEDAPGTLWDEERGALVHRPASRPGSAPTAAAVLAAIEAALPRQVASC